MSTRIALRRVALAGAMTGVTLYVVCFAFFLLIYGGQGSWMLDPFMPGLSTNLGGLIVGLGWSIAYGAGVPALFAFCFNAVGSPAEQGS